MAASRNRSEILDVLHEMLGPERTKEILQGLGETLALEKERDAIVSEAMKECVAAVETRFGAIDEYVLALLELLGPSALRLVTRLVSGSTMKTDHEDLWNWLNLVEKTVVEGKLFGARQVLEASLERRFGPLSPGQLVAVEIANAYQLDVCFRRLSDATCAEEVLDPLLEQLLADRAVRRERRALRCGCHGRAR